MPPGLSPSVPLSHSFPEIRSSSSKTRLKSVKRHLIPPEGVHQTIPPPENPQLGHIRLPMADRAVQGYRPDDPPDVPNRCGELAGLGSHCRPERSTPLPTPGLVGQRKYASQLHRISRWVHRLALPFLRLDHALPSPSRRLVISPGLPSNCLRSLPRPA